MNYNAIENLIESDKSIAYVIRDEEEINRGNRIVLFDDNGNKTETNNIPNVTFQFKGGNSLVLIHQSVSINDAHFEIGEGCFIFIDKGFRVRQKLYVNIANRNNTLYVGRFSNIGDATIYAGDDPNLEVIIGSNFLSAYNLKLRVSDGHTIFDKDSGKVLNATKFGIHIANHVWCGMNVTIIKDVVIPHDCVVGACALVCKKNFNPNTIISGVPAKEIRSNISWSSLPIQDYIQKNNKQ